MKFLGIVDNGPINRSVKFGYVPDFRGAFTFNLPKIEDQDHGQRGFGHITTY